MAKEEVNAQRAERQGFKGGKGSGKQGGNGSGDVVRSGDSVSKPGPAFKSAAEVIGQPIYGEFEVGGVEAVKGVSAPSFATATQGDKTVGKSLGVTAKAPKNATDSGFK